MLELKICGEPKEIAALVMAIQERQIKASDEELCYLEERKKAWDEIHSRETSPPCTE